METKSKKIIAYIAMTVGSFSFLCALGSSIGIVIYLSNIFRVTGMNVGFYLQLAI